MNDTVREELQTKITTGVPARPNPPLQPPAQALIKERSLPRSFTVSPAAKRVETADLTPPKTSPTLVEFQNKNTVLPDWRIQLQNAVKQRRGGAALGGASAETGPAPVRAEAKQLTAPRPEISDPRVANALKRINESRTTFVEPQPRMTPVKKAQPAQMRPFPFDVVSTTPAPSPAIRSGGNIPPLAPCISMPQKPALVESPVLKRDTNKLPPLVEPLTEEVDPFVQREPKNKLITETPIGAPPPAEFAEIKRIRIKADDLQIDETELADYDEEIEDLAPLPMRFGAGLFDMITGTFLAGLALMPFVLNGADFVNSRGLLIYTGTWAVTQFIYMTVCLGFLGKTLGMRLFSLELVDAVENEYPTLRQAAVNSCVYILGLPLAGAGFLTVFFNEEHRALHDLMSGTIQVREF